MSIALFDSERLLGDSAVPELGSEVRTVTDEPQGGYAWIVNIDEDDEGGDTKSGDDEGDGFERDEDDDGLIPWTEVEQPAQDFDENDFDDDFDDDFEVDIEEEEFDEQDGDLDIGEEA